VTDATLRLRAQISDAGAGDRRGVVLLSGATMAALGLSHWDPVRLRAAPPGSGETAAVVAPAPPGTHPFLVLLDAATLATLGIAEGSDVDVGPAVAPPANRVVLADTGGAGLLRSVPLDVVRLALLGRVVSRGDEIGLAAPDLITARVATVEPAGPASVTMATTVALQTGRETATSATPGLGSRLGAENRAAAAVTGAAATGAAVTEAADSPQPPPGLDQPHAALREWLDLDFHHHELLARLGSGRRLGALVSGPAGSGKVSLVRAAAAAVGARVVHLWAPELAGLSADAVVARLRAAGERAATLTPAVLLIEDIDAVVGTARPSGAEGMLLAEITARVTDARVAVVATTSHPDACDPRLRAPGLLEREVVLSLYTRAQRHQALAALTSAVPLAGDVDLAAVAARSPGFVLADLVSLVHEAGVRAAGRQRPTGAQGVGAEVAGSSVAAPSVTMADFDGALAVVRPTGAEGGSLEVPDLDLDDVGDMAEVKAALTETVLWPLTHPDTFSRLGVDPPRGVLLYGPPGCGKTYLVRALAGTGQVTVLPVKGAEVLSKWVGESERGLREVFRRARQSAPALVFLDEIDALAPQRGQSSDSGVTDRVVAALLTELDGIDQMAGVSVIGATNRPDLIDAAVLRPGRLERLVFVPPPDAEARGLILASAAKHSPLAADVDLAEIGRRTEGYSAADCAALVREAALTAMRRSMESAQITLADVEAALGAVSPSLDPLQVASMAAFAQSRTG